MKKLPRPRVLVWALACVACGGAPTRPGAPETGDPAQEREFRLQFSNPGGMWLPEQLKLPRHIETLRRMGVRIDPVARSEPFADEIGAVVSLGGCTGAFISSDGLILTNYHCVKDVLQANTDLSTGRNLLEDGFLARTRADEIELGAWRDAVVSDAVTDVTAQMRDGLDALRDPVSRALREEQHVKELYRACNQHQWRFRCHIRPYYGGAMYLQTESFVLQDLRLVYVPASGVGDYGGEVDNWKWPRHQGDWALLRAYARPDGTSARYSTSNVPYHPRHRLAVNPAGIKAGDFVMTAGYPWFTDRTATAASLRDMVESVLPARIELGKVKYAAAERLAAAPTDTGIKARLAKESIQGSLAKNEATLAALSAGDILAQRTALDRRIRDWAAQPGHERHQLAIHALDQLQTEYARTSRVDEIRRQVFAGSLLLDDAFYLLQWAEQRGRASDDRRAYFQDNYIANASRVEHSIQNQYDRALDRATFQRVLVLACHLPAAERAWLPALLGIDESAPIDEALIDRTLDAWYRAPQIEGEDQRIAWLEIATPADLEASTDPFIQAARRTWAVYKADEERALARRGESILLMPWYLAAMQQLLGDTPAPDANGSLRVSYGTVKPAAAAPGRPAGSPFTVASELLAKNTGVEPFRAPDRLLSAIVARTYGPYADPALGGEVPINFLSDLDSTGGNSGSPVLDRHGTLVGLVFDLTLDSAPDFAFDPASARTISVDIRYLIWTLEMLPGGDRLLSEIGLPRTLP